MRTLNYVRTIIAIMLLTFLGSCEDNQVTEETVEETGEEKDFICVGLQNNDILPLAIGNRWYFKKKLGGSNLDVSITGKTVKNGKEYFELSTKTSSLKRYIRKAANGDVYELESFDFGEDEEYLLVPGSPVDGQEWDYYGYSNADYKRRIRIVTNPDFAIKTDLCTYEGYVLVDVVSIGTSPTGNDEIITNEAFFPGIGFIEGSARELSELELNAQ